MLLIKKKKLDEFEFGLLPYEQQECTAMEQLCEAILWYSGDVS